MHANAALLEKLFTSLNKHSNQAMAECYHLDAVFRDIAFDLQGRGAIHEMWQMICQARSNLRATYEVLNADDHSGRVSLVDDYRFCARVTARPAPGAKCTTLSIQSSDSGRG
jgi:hypothetical protein